MALNTMTFITLLFELYQNEKGNHQKVIALVQVAKANLFF